MIISLCFYSEFKFQNYSVVLDKMEKKGDIIQDKNFTLAVFSNKIQNTCYVAFGILKLTKWRF